jgi:tetratricopeptide (TPR) repeat protein
MRGIDNLYGLEIDKAAATFDSVCHMAPTDPRGYFFKSMVNFWLFALRRNQDDYDTFMDESDKVISACESILESDEDNPVATFYLGGIYGYRGMAHQANGSMFKAVTEGRKGYIYLEEAVALDSTLYDAQMGFGLFRYMIAKAPRSLSWIASVLGFSGDLEGGLALLKHAAEKGLYTKTEAAYYLAQFLFAEHRQDEAFHYMRMVIDRYPDNTLFLLTLAGWQLRLNNPDEALGLAQKAAAITDRKKFRYGEEFLYSTLGGIYYSLNEFTKARDAYALYLQKVQTREYISNWMYYRMGVSHEIAGDRTRAAEIYRMMRKADDAERAWDARYYRMGQDRLGAPLGEVDVLLIKAGNEAARKRYEPALALYNEALAKGAGNPDLQARALYGEQGIYYDHGEYPQVVTLSHQLLSTHPVRELWLIPHGYFRLGQALAKLGRTEEARQAFEKISEYDDYESQTSLESRAEEELARLKKN